MEKQIIQEKVLTARRQRLVNNCYSMDAVNRCTNFWNKEEEFIFSWEDHGVQRLTFFVKNWKSLDDLLTLIDGGKYYLEFMTKEPEEIVPVGTERVAAMMRLANSDCRSVLELDSPVLRYLDPTIGVPAVEQDIREINQILWNTFHTEISHLLTDTEMKTKIEQIIIHRKDQKIDAILQAEVLPKRFYINQIVNHGDRKNIHAMLLNCLKKYIDAGGKYLYAWVADNNIASQKFHAKYGMTHDGMWNMIYCLES